MTGLRAAHVGSAILFLFCAAYAFLAFGNGMDRMSGANPARASLVPSVLRANAARVEAGVALSKSELESAEELAREAIAASPRNERVAGLLASAHLFGGDPAAAHQVLASARDSGWRDPIAQAYWANDSLARGEAAQAVSHLEALMLTEPNAALGEPILAAIANSDDARKALIDRVKSHEPFARALFEVDAGDLSTSVALRGELLLDPMLEAQPDGCSIAGDVIEGLAERQMSAEAEAVATAHCAI